MGSIKALNQSLDFLPYIQETNSGEMPEWLNGTVSKTVIRLAYRGFESLFLRQSINAKFFRNYFSSSKTTL